MRRRWILVVLVVIVAGVTWRVWGMARRAPAEAPSELVSVPVEVASVRTSTLLATVSAGGSVEATDEVMVTSKIPGRVAAVYAREGETVRAGQVLVRLDTAETIAQVQQAEAALAGARARLVLLEQGARPQERAQVEAGLAQAEANYQSAESNFTRMQSLFTTGAISKAQLDAAALQRDVARAQLDTARQQQSLVRTGARPEEIEMARAQVSQAQAAVTLARLQIANSTIVAPLAGVVTRRAINPGELAAPGVPLLVVSQIGSVYVTLDLSETDLGPVRLGQAVNLRVDAYPGRIFTGVVREVAPAGDPRTRTFKVKVAVPNPDRALRPGMFARGEITVGRVVNALVIPRDAVSTDSGSPTVFVVVGGVAKSRTVALGPTYGPVVEIRGGLALGDSVIVSGQSGLTDGTAVTVR